MKRLLWIAAFVAVFAVGFLTGRFTAEPDGDYVIQTHSMGPTVSTLVVRLDRSTGETYFKVIGPGTQSGMWLPLR